MPEAAVVRRSSVRRSAGSGRGPAGLPALLHATARAREPILKLYLKFQLPGMVK